MRRRERRKSYERDIERDVFVEGEVHAVAVSSVVVSAMNEEQLDQVVELPDDVVRVVHRRVALLSLHSHAHRALANHRHVVGAVADRQTAQSFLLHQQNHAGLLLRGHAGADHRRGFAHRVHERRLLRSNELVDRDAVENEREGSEGNEMRRGIGTTRRAELKQTLRPLLILCVVLLDSEVLLVVGVLQRRVQLQRDVLFAPCEIEELHGVGEKPAIPRDDHRRLLLVAYIPSNALLLPVAIATGIPASRSS